MAQLIELSEQRVLELDEGEHRAQLPQEPALFGLDQVSEAKVAAAAPDQKLLDDPKERYMGPGAGVQFVREVLFGGDGLEGGRPSRHVQVFFGNALAVAEL